MTERIGPPPLPNAGSATPPPLPKHRAAPTQLPLEKSSPPPLPTVHIESQPLPRADAAPSPVPAQEKEPPSSSAATPAADPQALKLASGDTKQLARGGQEELPVSRAMEGVDASASGKSLSTGAKLGISFAAIAALAGIGYGMFGGQEAAVSQTAKQISAPAPSPAIVAMESVPVRREGQAVSSAGTNAPDEKDDKIRQLETKLAEAERERQQALNAAAERKASERVTAPPVAVSASAPGAVKQSQPAQFPGTVFQAESRTLGESCNSHSDCRGALKCFSGQCVSNAGGRATGPVEAPQAERGSIPKNAKHLVGGYYLFKDSVKDLGNGFRGVYAYLNDDVPNGHPQHGQVQSQAARYVMNCQSAQFGMDQLYFFSQPNAQGQRVAWQEWQPNQVTFSPIQNAMEHIRKSYDFACGK